MNDFKIKVADLSRQMIHTGGPTNEMLEIFLRGFSGSLMGLNGDVTVNFLNYIIERANRRIDESFNVGVRTF